MSERDQFITRASYAVGAHRDHVAKVFDAAGDEITGGDFTTPLDGCVVLVELSMVRAGDPIIVREARRVLPMGAGHEIARNDDGDILREVVPDGDQIARSDEAADDLEDMKSAELHDLAVERGIDVPARATKAELIAALHADDGDGES